MSVIEPSPTTADYHFMGLALARAQTALDRGEFPVGCVIAAGGSVIATGARQGTAGGGKNETDHAEILALRELESLKPAIDPKQVTLYCTMEPCLMCYGAILIAGINRIAYAYEDAMGGGTGCDLSSLPDLYKKRQVFLIRGLMRARSLALFQAFFSDPANRYWQGSLLAEYTLRQE
jgi:tRNA(adenine34) deaminase